MYDVYIKYYGDDIVMERTQIYLDKTQKDNLRKIAEDKNESMAEIVREAVAQYIIVNKKTEDKVIKECAGIWEDREDIKDSDAYIQNMRKNWRGSKGE